MSSNEKKKQSRLIIMYKAKNNLADISNPHFPKATNAWRENTTTASSTTNYRNCSLYPRTVMDWNSLPEDTISVFTLETLTR